MEPAEGAKAFQATGDAYDLFMGRYSRSLAPAFADWAGVAQLGSALDVGCGPGALTAVLVDRLGAGSVSAMDPSPPFVEECRRRFPNVDVRHGRAETIPFEDNSFDGAFAQLVLHFVSDPEGAAVEFRRVVRPGGVVAACVWDFAEGMQMLRHFWDAALVLNPTAEDEARTMRFGREGEVSDLFRSAGLADVEESTLAVNASSRVVRRVLGRVHGGHRSGRRLPGCARRCHTAVAPCRTVRTSRLTVRRFHARRDGPSCQGARRRLTTARPPGRAGGWRCCSCSSAGRSAPGRRGTRARGASRTAGSAPRCAPCRGCGP